MCPEPDTSLSELVGAGLMQYISRIEEVSVTATKEFALEETLQRMQSEWNDICFEFLPYRDSDVSVLTGIEEIQGEQHETIIIMTLELNSLFIRFSSCGRSHSASANDARLTLYRSIRAGPSGLGGTISRRSRHDGRLDESAKHLALFGTDF